MAECEPACDKYLFGVKSPCMDSTQAGQEKYLQKVPGFHTPTDFDLYYDSTTKQYCFSVETIYQFDTRAEQQAYIMGIFQQLTAYCKQNGIDISHKPQVSDIFYDNRGYDFSSLQELYDYFKILVIGFALCP